MAKSDKPFDILRVTCPTCHERFDVDLAPQPQVVKCTFCAGRVSVPSREQAEREREERRPVPIPKVEDYKLAASPGAPKTPARPASVLRKTGKSSADKASSPHAKSGEGKAKRPAPRIVSVICPICDELLKAPAAESAAKIACTSCGTAVRVPSRDEMQHWKATQIAPRSKDEIGEYAAGAPIAPPPLRMHLFDRMAEIRSEAPIPPPRWTFFSSVFTFPWHSETITRWGGITFGFTVLSLISTFLLGGGGGTGPGGIGVVGMGFFALPLIWVTIFTLSFAADCFLCVLESTAYGMDRIEAWPDGGWKEWMPKLLYLGWIASVPTIVSYGAGRLAELGHVMFWPVMLGTLFVLFPISLLSALEANSIWMPLTVPIVKSLFVAWWAWLLFYFLVGLTVTSLGALIYFGLPRDEYATMIAFAPLLAATVLIYARLLGRLAWKIARKLNG